MQTSLNQFITTGSLMEPLAEPHPMVYKPLTNFCRRLHISWVTAILLIGVWVLPATVYSGPAIPGPCTALNTDSILELELDQLIEPDPMAPPSELFHPLQLPLPKTCLAVDAVIESGFLTDLGMANPAPDRDTYVLSLTAPTFWLSLSHNPGNLFTVTIMNAVNGQAIGTCTGRLNGCQVRATSARVNIVISAREPGVYILSIFNGVF